MPQQPDSSDQSKDASDFFRLSASDASSPPSTESETSSFSSRASAFDISPDILVQALHYTNEAVLITDAEIDPPGPRIVYANPAFEHMTGYSVDEILGLSPRIFQGPDTHRPVLAELRKALENGEEYRGQTVNYRKDGTPFTVQWHIAPIHNDAGDISYWVAVQRDVTERLRLERELLRVSAREQRRIAQELHDNLGQMLSGALLRTQAAEQDLRIVSTEGGLQENGSLLHELVDELATLRKLLRSIISRLRKHVQGLYPVDLQNGGLMRSLEELAANADALYDFKCTFRYDRPLHVTDPEAAANVYRIVQEAISNAGKHSGATEVDIRLVNNGENATLYIRDNGRGIEPDMQAGQPGLGLRIMEYRAEAIGATLEVGPAPNGPGTLVACHLRDNHGIALTPPEEGE